MEPGMPPLQLEEVVEELEVVENAVDIATLPKPMAVLRFRSECADGHGDECVFYILGTAHVSRASCDAASTLISQVRPDLVLLELCMERHPILSIEKLKDPSLSEALSEVRSGRATIFQAIYSWLLARVGQGLDVMPGEEFRVALREARAVGAQVVLADRPLSITLSRLWAALSTWERVKLSGALLWTGLSMDTDNMREEIERMKESDVLTEAIKELGKEFPSLVLPLLTERDLFMVHIMRRVARKARVVVAVVGAGHLPGIRENWGAEIDIEAICTVPQPRRAWRWGRIALLAGAATAAAITVVRWRQR